MLRGERGQASVTYGGILAVLAGVFLAMFSLGLDQKISRAVDAAV